MDPIFNEEKKHLNTVKKKLKEAKATIETNVKTMGTDTLEKLKELRDNPESGEDFYIYLEQLNDQNVSFNFKDKYQRLEELEFLIKEPYFSRIDLYNKDENQKHELYIGKFGYTEQTDPIITDWRAKVASVYYRYRYPQKNVSYETEEGKETRDLLLKRTYEIDGGQLLKYYNNDLQLDEKEIIVDKLEHRTGGVLEDIVETIQESQLDIIESDPRQVTIVQGCVGSGKSTVAIHKLSHLFFNYPDLIHPNRSLLVAKNQILIGYLSTLFPKLGIFDVTYKTLRDLVFNIMFREELRTDFDLDLNTDTSKFTFEIKENIDKLILNAHDHFESKINDIFAEPEFEPFGGLKYSKNSTIYQNLRESLSEIEEELSFQKEQLKENPNSPKAWFYKDNIRILRRIATKLHDLQLDLRHRTFKEITTKIGVSPNEKMGYYETLLYLYVYAELIGFTKHIKYEYCVIDEGQDFSILEYFILANFVIKGRFAIFGDLNQSLNDEGVASWDDISKVIKEAKHAQTYQLDTNYRSTKPIIDLANKIISPYTKNYLPKSINRKGNDPKIQTFDTTEALLTDFESEIKNDLKGLDKSIGVISFDKDLLDKAEQIIRNKSVSKGLKKDHIIKLHSKIRITYIPKGVYLMNFDDCKGLEFSKVYVLGLHLNNIKDFKDAKRAFVAVTRAMNELTVLGTK